MPIAADMNSRKVVIVDGDGDTCDAISRALRMHGWEPIVSRRGQGVVKLVKDQDPATVVMELSLPDYDGVLLLRELKDDWDAKKIPIVVVSGYTSRLNAGSREHVEGILPKPFSMDELLHQVEVAATHKQKY